MEQTTEGQRVQGLTMLDAYTRAGWAMHCARARTGAEVSQGVEPLCASRGAPGYVNSDPGPECIVQEVTPWLRAPPSEPHLMEPGSPWHTGHHERWHGVCRDGGLHRWLWFSGAEARRIMTTW